MKRKRPPRAEKWSLPSEDIPEQDLTEGERFGRALHPCRTGLGSYPALVNKFDWLARFEAIYNEIGSGRDVPFWLRWHSLIQLSYCNWMIPDKPPWACPPEQQMSPMPITTRCTGTVLSSINDWPEQPDCDLRNIALELEASHISNGRRRTVLGPAFNKVYEHLVSDPYASGVIEPEDHCVILDPHVAGLGPFRACYGVTPEMWASHAAWLVSRVGEAGESGVRIVAATLLNILAFVYGTPGWAVEELRAPMQWCFFPAEFRGQWLPAACWGLQPRRSDIVVSRGHLDWSDLLLQFPEERPPSD